MIQITSKARPHPAASSPPPRPSPSTPLRPPPGRRGPRPGLRRSNRPRPGAFFHGDPPGGGRFTRAFHGVISWWCYGDFSRKKWWFYSKHGGFLWILFWENGWTWKFYKRIWISWDFTGQIWETITERIWMKLHHQKTDVTKPWTGWTGWGFTSQFRLLRGGVWVR